MIILVVMLSLRKLYLPPFMNMDSKILRLEWLTHFELYRDAIHSWGFTEQEILNHQGIFPECSELSAYNEGMAQNGALATALGCHIALEETADREFTLLFEGFATHWQAYGLTGLDDPALGFYQIHIIQEPLHG